MRDVIVTLAIFATLPYIWKRAWVGILVWSWLAYMNPHRLAWGFAFDFPFAQVVAVVTMASMLKPTERRSLPGFPWTREMIVLLLFTVWMFITTIDAGVPLAAWPQWDKVWKIMLFTFFTAWLIDTREKLQTLVWVIALSLAFYGVKGGIFTLTTGGVHNVMGPPGSFMEVRGGIGMALNMTIPLLRYLQLSTPKRWVQLALLPVMGLTAVAVVGTHGRGALLGLLAMSVVFMLKTRRALFIGLFGALVGYMTWTYMPIEYKERMLTVLDPEVTETDASAMGRINAWKAALYRVEREPITGGGFETLAWEGTDAHNIIFEVLAEHGWVGLFLYLLFWLLGWRTASRVARVARKHPDTLWMRDLVAMIQTGLIGYAVSGMFLGLAYFDLFYCYIVIIVITRLLLDRAVAERSGQAHEPLAGYPPGTRAAPAASARACESDPTPAGPGPAPRADHGLWRPPLY